MLPHLNIHCTSSEKPYNTLKIQIIKYDIQLPHTILSKFITSGDHALITMAGLLAAGVVPHLLHLELMDRPSNIRLENALQRSMTYNI